MSIRFTAIKAAVFDMDGVLWRGYEALPGLDDLFAWLEASGIPYVLATNNATNAPERYVHKLAMMGIEGVPVERIVSSATATADYMQRHYPAGTPVYVFGMEPLRQIIENAGFDTSNEEPAQVVVAGGHFELTYEALKQATFAIRAGADFIGTNPDKTYPLPEGLAPGAGAMIAALEAATDREATIIGKPGAPMFEAALKIMGTAPEETLMVGDRLNTDILGGRRAGLKTALLLTGVTTSAELAQDNNETWPDVAFDGLPELLRTWAGDAWYRARMKASRER